MGRQLLICLFLSCTWVGTWAELESRPPSIYIQPSSDVYFKPGEYVELPCEAKAVPNAVYTWKRNGYAFDPSGNDDRIIQLQDVGTILFVRPEGKDEGIYQCVASNDHGVSASIKVNFREAKLGYFPPEAPITYRPPLSSPVTLQCLYPDSVPRPDVFWAIKGKEGNITPLDLDARITMDHESRLRITNVKLQDEQGGNAYVCIAMNSILRRNTLGPENFIQPQGVTEETSPVSYLWASPSDQLGLRGEPFKIKCIFAGSPTPEVSWTRMDGKPLPDHVKLTSFGQELLFEPLESSDEGDYRCQGINMASPQPAERIISVRVESRPYWIEEPQDLDIGIGGVASFKCRAGGVPEPEIHWYLNTVPLDKVTDPRIDYRFKKVSPNEIIVMDLTPSDAMVIQCNATNKHGYLWGDVYLNVDYSSIDFPHVSAGGVKMQTTPLEGTIVVIFSLLLLWNSISFF